jgi:hypothetical protein
MAIQYKDRVKETSTSTGLSDFTLLGPSTGYQSFAVFGANQFYYVIEAVDSNGFQVGDWEVGIGTYNAGTLFRSTVLASSNGGAKISFVAGTKNVFSSAPGDYFANAAVAGGSIEVVAGGTTQSLTHLAFANSNGISFGLSNSVITGSVAPGGGNVRFSAGTLSATRTDLTFADSNGVSFGLNTNGNVTATVKTDYQTSGNYLTTAMQSNAVTLSNIKVSGGTLSSLRSDITFADSNGLSFGLNTNGILTGTVKTDYQSSNVNYQTSQSGQAASAANGSFAFQTVSFSNVNGISFGTSAGSAITASHNAITSQSVQTQSNVQGLSAGTQVGRTGDIVFANSNGISFGMSGSSQVTASYTVPTQSNQSAGLYALGNTTQNSSTTLDARTLSFNALGGMTVGYSNGSIQLSAPTTAAQTNQSVGFYGVGNTTQNSSTTLDARTVSFRGNQDITIGYSNGSVQLSVNVTGAQSNQSAGFYGVGNTTQNSSTTLDARTLSFGGRGDITVGYSNGTVQISGNQTNQSAGLYALGNTTQNSSTTLDARTLSFNGLGGMTVGYSNGSIQLSAPTTAAQTNQSVGFYAVGNTTQNSSTTLDARTISFNAIGSITAGFSNGSIQLSLGNYLTTAALSGDSSKYVQNWKATGNTSGTTSSAQGSDLWFSGGANVTISGSSNSIVFSAGNTIKTFQGGISNLGTTAGSTGTVDAQLVFVGSNDITLSGSTEAGLHSATVSIVGVPHQSYFRFGEDPNNTVTFSFAQSTSYFAPFELQRNYSFDRMRVLASGSVAASSTQATTGGTSFSMSAITSHNIVMYSRGVGANSQSLQFLTSTQVVDQCLMTASIAANSSNHSVSLRFTIGNQSFTKDYSSTVTRQDWHTSHLTDLTGMKYLDLPLGLSLSPGQLWLGYGRSTTFATQNASISVATRMAVSHNSMIAISQNTIPLGMLGGDTNSSVGWRPGHGSFSTGGAGGTTNSIPIANISTTASNAALFAQLMRIT